MTNLSERAATGEHIAFRAAQRPNNIAFVSQGRAISYSELHRDIGNFASALVELGLRPGSAAAVGCDDFYLHLVLLLAFERLRVATASYHHREGLAECRELLGGVDIVVSEKHFPLYGAVHHRSITSEWIAGALARPQGDPPSACPVDADPVRILRSSGTTGRPKRLLVTRRMYEARMAVYAWQYGFATESRYLITLPFSANPSYGAATACLRAGGTVVSSPLEGRGGVPRAIVNYGITHMTLQPIMLKQVLDDLAPDFVKPDRLHVVTLGSALSEVLSSRALTYFATEVTDVFGCNEVGGITRRRISLGDRFAEVAPGIEVQAVDEYDRPIAHGDPGRLAIRGQALIEGYLGEPEMTRRHFRNGWFYSGDIGIVDGAGLLRILGRGDDVLNIGGAKACPDDLESLVLAHVSARDVGVCSFANRDGIEEVYVAVSGVQQDHRNLLAQIERSFVHQQLGFFRVVVLPAIPRNAAGKIQRAALKEAIANATGLTG